MERSRTAKWYSDSIVSAFLVALILLSLFLIKGYAPFGDNSLACMDADIQYLDFFAYLQDVLKGLNSPLYSFSKGLGGNNIAVVSYYLCSPFNLLVLLFPKSELHACFNFLFLLKSVCCAVVFSYYLNRRFASRITKKNDRMYIILLSVCYACSQYTLAQASNIMWLDGVYILPLILLGVYDVVSGKGMKRLSICVALSMLFNWYTGAINCLFSVGWFFLEYLLKEQKSDFKHFIRTSLRYALAMLCGVMISCALFVPTVFALRNSARGSVELRSLLNFKFHKNVLSFVQSYTSGATSNDDKISLYSGVLPLIGLLTVFVSKDVSVRNKIIYFVFLGLCVLMLFWHPLYYLFSLLSPVSSYWCRFSYTVIMYILFLGASGLLGDSTDRRAYLIIPVYIGVYLLLHLLHPLESTVNTLQTAGIMLLCLLSFLCVKEYKGKYRSAVLPVLFCTVICDICYEASSMMNLYHVSSVHFFRTYAEKQELLIDKIQGSDDSVYRITQTLTGLPGSNHLTAKYNEALAYNYRSLESYTSSSDDIVRFFMERAGYRRNGDNMSIKNNVILGTDSLLGVKYVLSDYDPPGLNQSSLSGGTDKNIYENPYVLPVAFCFRNENDVLDDSDPFVYQNELYSALLGRNVELYRSLSFELVSEGNTKKEEPRVYRVSLSDGDYAFYGNIPWKNRMPADLYIDDEFITAYAQWGSPSVFTIRKQGGEDITVSLIASGEYSIADEGEQFYSLDLNLFQSVSDELKEKTADAILMENGYVSVQCNGESGYSLFLSIPYDAGWIIKRNGETVTPVLFADCFYTIPLVEGENTIEMQYRLPGKKIGIAISLAGLFLLAAFGWYEKQSNGRRILNYTEKGN